MSRRRARETAFQALCALDLAGGRLMGVLLSLDGYASLSKRDKEYAETLLTEAYQHRRKMDAYYQPHLKQWKVSRLATVDRNLLRLALYEIFYEGLPPAVAIYEVVELAKRYGSEKSSAIIHGILGAVLKKRSLKSD